MKPDKKHITLIIFLAAAGALFWMSGLHQHLTFENVRENREALFSFVERNYTFSVLLFLAAYISTAFFVPGTLALTVASGFLFGFAAGTFYAMLGACFGAFTAFLTSRYLIGTWIQKRFDRQLRAFNREISLHGYNYLLAFRIVPVLPFFMINYIAGITNISKWTFIWTTAAGMLPGALICTFAGRQLGTITSAQSIFSVEIITALALLAALILLPPAMRHAGKLFRNIP